MPTDNNSTYEEGFADPAAKARFPVIVTLYIPAFLVSEIGNGFLVYTLAYIKRRQRAAIDSYILNLAISDFLLTTMTLFNAIEYVRNEWVLGEAMCKIHGQLLEVCYTVEILTLLAVSYKRRKAVDNPFQ
ncbi:neuromedin-U receptor 2-like, partial [Paramuricea clavata]